MTTDPSLDPSHQQPDKSRSAVVKINGETVAVDDWTPTARQILTAAGLQPVTEYALLSWPEQGPTEELGLDEAIHLPRNGAIAEFLAMQADGVFYFMLNDQRFAWAGSLTAEDVRKVGRVPATMELWLERRDEPDVQLEAEDAVDLLAPGVERIYKRDPAAYVEQVKAGYMPGSLEQSPSVITVNMHAASMGVQELIARLYPYRLDGNSCCARTMFSLAEKEYEHFSEADFTPQESLKLATGLSEPLLGLPSLRARQ